MTPTIATIVSIIPIDILILKKSIFDNAKTIVLEKHIGIIAKNISIILALLNPTTIAMGLTISTIIIPTIITAIFIIPTGISCCS